MASNIGMLGVILLPTLYFNYTLCSWTDFAEISREDSDWQLETEEEPLEDKKKSQESSLMVDDEEDVSLPRES